MPRPPRVFISRTTAGLKSLGQQIAEILRQRGIEVIIEEGFYPSTHDIRGMLVDHLHQCDAVICLIGSAYGTGPHDPITKAEQPIHGLKDPRTKDHLFSYSQLELLVARDLGRPIYTFFIDGDELPTAFAPEPPELAHRQQTFITEFAKDTRNTYGTFSQWDQPSDPARGLKQAIEAIKFEITVLAGKPTNLPYTSLGTLFKGRDEFLTELRHHLTAEGPVVIKGKRTIHGMGGVGKTRAAIEYAWKHADDYRALLFISADTPEALHRNLASLCGPLVLNLPEQNEKEQALQVEAALRWLKLHPGWFLIIDNVDTDEAAEETKALLAKLATGHVLITSRISDWTGHVKSLDLDVLSAAASIAFLNERTEERRPIKDDDHEKVAALVQLLDCLALALEQAGAHISANSISYADYIALWESHRSDALDWHDEETMKYPKSLAITYETSVAQLSKSAKELFRILSWFAPDPIPRSILDSRPNPMNENRHLGEIERLHLARYLVDIGNGKAFAIHRLNLEITRQQQIQATGISMYSSQQEIFRENARPPVPPPDLVSALHWINLVYPSDTVDVRNWPVALPLTSHALATSQAGVTYSVFEPTSHLLRATALLFKTRADYSTAEPLYRQALSLEEKHHGLDHPDVATTLTDLASLLAETNRREEAESMMRRALAIDEVSSDSDHLTLVISLNNLGRLLQEMNKLEEAELLMRRALGILESAPSFDNPKVAICLNSLATFLYSKNRLEEAEPLMRRALSLSEVAFGPDHPVVSGSLNNLAGFLFAINRFEEAEPLMWRVLSIDEGSFGPDHPLVANRLNNIARLLQATNRLGEAEPLMRRMMEILVLFTQGTGHPHPYFQHAMSNYTHLLLQMGHGEREVREKLDKLVGSIVIHG